MPNKIEVIELRTDPKYGKFMTHTPARAKVSVKRKKDGLHVTIVDFTSPTIIDPAYDGQVFNIPLTDSPEKKADLVNGSYILPVSGGSTTVAVKIIDMLGEEVFVAMEV